MKEEYKSSQAMPQKANFPAYAGSASTHSQGIYGFGSKKMATTTIVGAILCTSGFIFSLCVPFLGIILCVLGVLIAFLSYGVTIKENKPGKEILIGSMVIGAVGILISIANVILAVLAASAIG